MKNSSSYNIQTLATLALAAAAMFVVPQLAYAQAVIPDAPRIVEAGEILLGLIEGPFGELIMIVSGLVAIIASAMGAYRAAMSSLVVALGAFILRTMVEVFFPQ